MFIKLSALARKMKAANKAGTLRIGSDPDEMDYRGYYISGSWWAVHISAKETPKDIKAEIVKYLGELPEGGKEWQIQKGIAQSCIYGTLDMFLPKWDVKAVKPYFWTKYMISELNDIRIYQNPDTQDLIGMDEELLALIDDSSTSSYQPNRPRLSSRGTFMWSDDDTVLELYPMDISRTKFVEYMKYCDLLEMDPEQPTTGRADPGESEGEDPEEEPENGSRPDDDEDSEDGGNA